MESFPASDPPPWTATHAGSPIPQVNTDTPSDMRRRLRKDVDVLALEIGERNDQSPKAGSHLAEAAEYITSQLLDAGRHIVRIPMDTKPELENIEAVVRGTTDGDEIVIGAHYDSLHGTNGAYDNASGVAVLLGLARVLTGRRFQKTVRLVAFTRGAEPDVGSNTGSRAYAKRLVENDVTLRGMLSLDSVGYHVDRKDRRRRLPFPLSRVFGPWPGDFVAFVGDMRSGKFVDEVGNAFELATDLEVRTFALPRFLPLLAKSDHRAFAREGFPSALVTDTGPFLDPRFDVGKDLPDRLNYDLMADVVFGLASVVARMAGGEAIAVAEPKKSKDRK